MRSNESNMPFLIGGALLALLLFIITTRSGPPNAAALNQQFAPRPTDPNAPTPAPFQLPQVNLPSLPPELQRQVTGIQEQLAGGGTTPALTPTASDATVRIQVAELRRNGVNIQVRGTIRNISTAPITVPPEAFSFRDSTGTTYSTAGSGSATLAPNQETSFDLTVPLPENHGLTMIVSLPPNPPLEQILLVQVNNTKP